ASASADSTGQTVEVSETWKRRFAIIEKAGGPKLPKYRALERKERHEIAFNVWAGFLGPFYYLAKGMWKKALVLTPLVIIVAIIVEYLFTLVFSDPTMGRTVAPFVAGFGIWGPRANKDYYRKVV